MTTTRAPRRNPAIPPVNLRLMPEVMDAINARHEPLERGPHYKGQASRSTIINRDLSRYYQLLKLHRMILRQHFSQQEMLLLADIMDGKIMEPYASGMLLIEYLDATHTDQSLFTKRQVFADALDDKVKQLTDAEEMTIIDAIERWWLNPDPDRSIL